jgi:hypothetical protein
MRAFSIGDVFEIALEGGFYGYVQLVKIDSKFGFLFLILSELCNKPAEFMKLNFGHVDRFVYINKTYIRKKWRFLGGAGMRWD